MAELQNQSQRLLEAGFLEDSPKTSDKNGAYQEYLQILDLLAGKATTSSLVLELEPIREKIVRMKKSPTDELTIKKGLADPSGKKVGYEQITGTMRQKIVRATKLRDFGYKSLAFLG